MDNFFLHNHLGLFDPLLIKQKAPTYPPHNIYRYENDNYLIEVAVAGISREQLEVVQHKDVLKIIANTTNKQVDDNETPAERMQTLHQGIATRAFELKFKLGNYMNVEQVTVVNGILQVHLTQEIPEEEKPRKFDIK